MVGLQMEKWFFRWLARDAAAGTAGRIRQLSLRITDICNLRCLTCGQWGETGFLRDCNLADLKRDEVSPQRYREVFDDLAANGHRPIVYLWGGEPMLYPGAVELIEHTTALGLPTSIATNGTRIADAAERLVRAPLFLLQVSIDGPTAAVHDRIRPAAGGASNFAEIERGLAAIHRERTARRRALPIIASLTTISRENENRLVEIYDAFRDRIDMAVFYLSWWIDEDRAAAHEADFQRRFGFKPELHRGWIGGWKPSDYAGLAGQIEALVERSRRPGNPPVTFIPNVAGEESLRRYYTDHAYTFGFDQCISIYQAVEINSNGDLSPCRDYHDYVAGNIKAETVTALWNNEAYRTFRRSLHGDGLMPVCSRCCGLMGY